MRPYRSRPGWSRRVAAALGAAVLAGCGGGMRTGAGAPHPEPAPYAAADVAFMQGMIAHHGQAVLMATWAPTHGASAAVRELCARIAISQRDEIAAMERWLGQRRQAIPAVDTATGRMRSGSGAGMEGMSGMGADSLMPGMLTPAQLAQLDAARGLEFDALFLRLMIQHHRGAVAMVQRLVSTAGAAQDGFVFQFASDVDADQSAEIDRMRRMLAALTFGEGNP